MSVPTNDGGASAPWFPLREESIMSVEHPCVVKNSAKGIEMLGGPRALSQTLDLGVERTLALSFAPDDPSSRTILSLHHRTNDVLLKITVPKRTGRKRKRGSDGPFIERTLSPSNGPNTSQIVRAMQDNPTSYTAETVGSISSSHVWRSMPDFSFTSQGSTFMREIEGKLLPKDYSSMKQFRLQRAYGTQDHESIPPPVLSSQSMPYHYFYRQNQAVLKVPDASGATPVNRVAATKTYTHQWQYDGEVVPSKPTAECPPLEDQPKQVRDIVDCLRPLFEERHIWSRRALLNRLPDDTAFFFAKHAMAYVAFVIRSGPWRDTLCRFGIDPRSDSKYRKYQTILLQILNAKKTSTQNGVSEASEKHWVHNRDTESHIFTGTKDVPADGKVWQLCDIEDEQLKSLVEINDLYLRPVCETRYFGWYPNGTYAKLKILLKIKVEKLIAGTSIEPKLFERFMQLPDQLDVTFDPSAVIGSDLAQGYLPRDSSKDEMEWAASYRSLVRTPAGALPISGSMGHGRFNVPNSTSRPSYINSEVDVEERDVTQGLKSMT